MKRRAFLATCGTALASAAGCLGLESPNEADSVGDPIPAGATVALEPVVTGPTPGEENGLGPRFPVDLDVAPESDYRYVVDRPGVVWAHGPDGLESDPALDLTDSVLTDDEQGLFAVALHPEFARNEKLYLRYSFPPTEDTPADYPHVSVLSEFQASDDRSTIRRDSERRLLGVAQPGTRHNGGALAFGPDDYLYVSFGEGQWLGGSDEIRQAEDWYDWNPGGNSQDTEENLLGSVLRIDVDGRENGKPYAVPDDNPLVGADGLDEHFAWGFRNPWRMGFSGGDLLVADVGEIAFEEVNRVQKGGNYGWNVREGTACFNGKQVGTPGPWCPEETPKGDPLRDPVIQYPHEVRGEDGVEKRYSAVIGGYVYENDTVPSLTGEYVFGDFSGHLLAATPTDGDDTWPVRRLTVAGGFPRVPLGYARDSDGELLVLSAGATGRVDRIVPAEQATTANEEGTDAN